MKHLTLNFYLSNPEICSLSSKVMIKISCYQILNKEIAKIIYIHGTRSPLPFWNVLGGMLKLCSLSPRLRSHSPCSRNDTVFARDAQHASLACARPKTLYHPKTRPLPSDTSPLFAEQSGFVLDWSSEKAPHFLQTLT